MNGLSEAEELELLALKRKRGARSQVRQATDAAKLLVRGNPGYNPAEQEAAGGLATFAGQIPFAHELGGATNAVLSAGYNAPGLVSDGDLKGFGSKVAQAYDDQVQETKGSSKDFQERRPNVAAVVKGTSLGFQGAGATKMLPTLLPAQTGNTAKDVATAGAAVGAESGLWGMLYGLGSEEGGSIDERLDRATEYGKTGAMVGLPLGMAMRGAPAAIESFKSQKKNSASGQVLEMARESGAEISGSSGKALVGLLKRAGYSGKDVSRGLADVSDLLQGGQTLIERPSLFAVELQKRFPAASKQIEEAFQQLATAPPKQGNTSITLQNAIDDQVASQNTYLDDVFQEKLGVATVTDEQAALAAERQAIGARRDQVMKYAPTDQRITGETRGNILSLLGDIAGDSRARPRLQQAARELGFGGSAKESIEKAMSDPAGAMRLLQRFGQVARESSDDVVRAYRAQAESLFDDVSRQGPRTEHGGFEKQVAAGQVGPYKAEQQKFAQNYSQEEAIQTARGKFAAARDPVKADEFISWYNTLPQGEQSLVQTVIRQDMEKMLRGGNIDADGAYLTNLRKKGVHDVLVRVLGQDGEDISRAIQNVADEQPALRALDPRTTGKVVKGAEADAARNLYTNNPLARVGDNIPPVNSAVLDAAMMIGGQPVPYATLARQALKVLRPRRATREGLAQILAMRPNAQRAATSQAPTPVRPPTEKLAIPGPAVGATATQPPPTTPKPSVRMEAPEVSGYGTTTVQPLDPEALVKPQEKALRPAMRHQLAKKRAALLDEQERSLPADQQVEIVQRRENWSKEPRQPAPPQRQSEWVQYNDPDYPEAGPLKKAAALGVISSPILGFGALMTYSNLRSKEGTDTPSFRRAMQALQRISEAQDAPSAPSLKPPSLGN